MTTFQPPRDLKYFFNLRVGLHLLPELRYLFKCLAQADVATTDRRRDEFGDPFDLGVRHLERPADILDRGLRSERSEGDDLADGVAAVQPGDVIDDVPTATDAKVDIDIGHGHTPGVEKALEEEIVLEGIDVSDLETVGDQRPRRRPATGSDGNRMLFGVANEVPDDEEVAGETHLLDHLDLAR